MGKFTGYLICTDCDGTLTYEAGKVSKENADAIKYFQQEGGLFTLATGRFPNHAKLFEHQITLNAPIVSLNGALLYDYQTSMPLKMWHINKNDCFELLSYVNERWQDVEAYYASGLNKKGGFEGYSFNPKECDQSGKSLRVFLEGMEEEPLKMLLFQNENITPIVQKDLKEKFGDRFSFDLSWKEGIEINSIECGKGIAVQYLKKHLKEHIHTTVGIGDYENDISLLRYADIGYAVENAILPLKTVADRITVKNTESAIAKIIYEL